MTSWNANCLVFQTCHGLYNIFSSLMQPFHIHLPESSFLSCNAVHVQVTYNFISVIYQNDPFPIFWSKHKLCIHLPRSVTATSGPVQTTSSALPLLYFICYALHIAPPLWPFPSIAYLIKHYIHASLCNGSAVIIILHKYKAHMALPSMHQ